MIKQLEKFEDVVRRHAFKGTLPPDEIRELEKEYQEVKKQTKTFIRSLYPKTGSKSRIPARYWRFDD